MCAGFECKRKIGIRKKKRKGGGVRRKERGGDKGFLGVCRLGACAAWKYSRGFAMFLLVLLDVHTGWCAVCGVVSWRVWSRWRAVCCGVGGDWGWGG